MFKFGINRFAAFVVRIAYIVALYAGVYLLFQRVGAGGTTMGQVISFAVPVAVLLHEFLQQQAVINLFRQWLRNPGSDAIKRPLMFHGGTLLLLTCFDAYCVMQVTPVALVLPILFFLSSVLVETEEDAGALLARNAHVMLMRTTRTMTRQWKQRVRSAEKRGIDLSNVGALLMEDAGNTADANRIRLINQELTRADSSRPNTSLKTRHTAQTGSSRELYLPSAQAGSGATAGNFPVQNAQHFPPVRMPRRLSPKAPKQRVYKVLDVADKSGEGAVYMAPSVLAKRAKVDEKTARRWKEQWCEEHSIQLVG